MNKLLTFIKTIFGYLVIGVVGSIIYIPCCIIACLPASWRYDNRLYYHLVSILYRITVWTTFVPISIEGKENLPTDAAIFVANHQSSLDIPFLGLLVNAHPHIWLFLSKFAKVPFFGFVARRMNVTVDISSLRKMVASIDVGFNLIAGKKRHLMIFPEGGRATDGKVHKFYSGFAIIAKKTGRPVVPVLMLNLYKVYPPGSFLVRHYPVYIVIGKPFIIGQQETESEFVARVYAWFEQRCCETNS